MPDYAFRAGCRSLVTLLLLTSGMFQLIAPVLAIGTAAGTPINNSATATYEDASTGTTINTTSNTVTVTVAEVAGLTAVPAGIIDNNGGSISTGDSISFNFLVTNVGNDATNLFIPGADNLTLQGLNPATLVVEADLDNNGTYETVIPAAGFTTTTPIPADGSVRVRVTGTVTATLAGSPVSVRIGNAGNNDNSPGTQNQTASGGLDEVRTVNAGATTPVNGERDASALNATTLATAVTSQAFATVLKTQAIYNPRTSATNDDLLTYRLDLRVASSAPAGSSLTPGTLEGTTINLDNGTATRILVSDVIPTNTQFDSTFTPTAPAGWTVVYSVTPIAGSTALTAVWTTVQPAANQITRVGFVYDGTLAPGSTTVNDLNGFRFRVITSGLPATGGTIANIAQSFGETLGDATNTLVFDESGDQNPNNYDGSNPGAPFDPATDTGVANPATQGTDGNNNNTGTGPAGEANIIGIVGTGTILNGPQSQPGAIGPNNNQDDFTNKTATDMPAGTQAAYNPAVVTFTNTVQNPPTNTSNLDNVVLRPIAPSEAWDAMLAKFPLINFPTLTNTYGANTDIPNGTTVKITLGGQSATYTFNGTIFTTSDPAVTITSLAPNASQNYTVEVDLPAGVAQVTAFPIPIVSFVDNNNDKLFVPANEPVFNITIDRLYTGFIRLLKESRILAANGTQLEGFTTSPTVRPQPGQLIEYRITYSNISTVNVGSGNTVLSANNLVITEDGILGANLTGGTNTVRPDNPNNWATFTTNVPNSALSSTPATITYYLAPIPLNGTGGSPTDPGSATTGYRSAVSGTINPGVNGTFIFRRQVR